VEVLLAQVVAQAAQVEQRDRRGQVPPVGDAIDLMEDGRVDLSEPLLDLPENVHATSSPSDAALPGRHRDRTRERSYHLGGGPDGWS